ncbi:RNAse P Rpr2/Rpp21/SNM1 subunit domain-containing protein [Crucibulum laeve]|uniref:RNAse P Rpr2/Rpp21/SNM1 subunit domain-containing protein n=1 Tax=Crucibulum laeve TaxID=68775 RepID=A0A5C3MGY6_9AGAR|nr:RNAse P Rpr2/Rpp21/SNM1 subunit domain-containing protein [Crucibulum laeve]
MVKKQKDDVPDVRSVANRDIIQRLNFLYQASVYLQSIPSVPSTENSSTTLESTSPIMLGSSHASISQKPGKKKKRSPKKRTTNDLARSYIGTMKVVGQKTVVKIDPAVKRTLCRGCNTTLIPGSTAIIRVKKSTSHWHMMIYTCLHCKATRRIPAPPTQSTTQSQPIPPKVREAKLTDAPMDSDNTNSSSSTRKLVPAKRWKLRRPLPLALRPDAGHAVFCGNNKILEESERGSGVYIT